MLQESKRVLMESAAAFGQSMRELSAKLSQPTPSLKTSQPCGVTALQPSSLISGRSGMTRNGILSQLPPLVCRIKERDFGLLPTPAARDWKKPILEGHANAFSASPEKPRFGNDWLCKRVEAWIRGQLLRLGDGVSGRLASSAVRQYGNAVVPQIPEAIGRAIMEVEMMKGEE